MISITIASISNFRSENSALARKNRPGNPTYHSWCPPSPVVRSWEAGSLEILLTRLGFCLASKSKVSRKQRFGNPTYHSWCPPSPVVRSSAAGSLVISMTRLGIIVSKNNFRTKNSDFAGKMRPGNLTYHSRCPPSPVVRLSAAGSLEISYSIRFIASKTNFRPENSDLETLLTFLVSPFAESKVLEGGFA